jgi:dTMP kinase
MKSKKKKAGGKRRKPKGRFIVIDGPDGCGKSTQTKLLAEAMATRMDVSSIVTVRDPGGTKIGEAIRQILLDPIHEKMDPACELLLYMASRKQLWAEVIKPALESGKCVISDRWMHSTCAYQGYAAKAGVENVMKIAEAAGLGWPDVSFILDLPAEEGLARIKREHDRMEQKGIAFHRRVRRHFLELVTVIPDCYVIDADRPKQKVHHDIMKVIENVVL